jgi:type VI secretion system protein ImpH
MDSPEPSGGEGLASSIDYEALANLNFFDLVQTLGRLYPDATPVGSTRAPSQEAVRFKAHATLGFPAAEVASVAPSAELADGLDIRLNLIGLYGPSSPMPTSLTERIIYAEGSNALGDFLDLFNHRLAGLLYLVWRHYRHYLRYERSASDPISQAAAALFGLLPGRDDPVAAERRTTLLPYAGLLSMYSRSASAIGGVLTHYFGIPYQIEEFVPRWIVLPENARFVLGCDLQLGSETLLGETMQDVTGHFRVWCGPVPFDRYVQYLPNRPDHAKLRGLIDLLVRDPLERDLGFRIEAQTVPDWKLGEGELGWTTFADPRSEGEPIEVVI